MNYFRRLHPTKEGHRLYRFITNDKVPPHKLRGPMRHHRDCDFLDGKGILRAFIRKGWLYITKDYAWNGCSPKRYVGFPPLGKWVGTPDFDKTIYASLVHDILFQFAEVGDYTFNDANYQFLCIMEDLKFPLALTYFNAVHTFGKRYYGHDNEGVQIKYHNDPDAIPVARVTPTTPKDD